MTRPERALAVLHDAATAVASSLSSLEDWGLAGTRPAQYKSDLVADAAAIGVLDRAGFGVLSEESGLHHPDRPVRVVLDPVDGSTNASRGLPWWATSLCAVDGDGPLAAVVVNQATGTRYAATRGGGATCDGRPLSPSRCTSIGSAIVGFNGYPRRHLGWSQFRSLGAAALDICAVAAGGLDAFIDCARSSLAVWDYMGAMLVCNEAGAPVAEFEGRDLVATAGAERRTFLAAATASLLADVLAGRMELEKIG